MLKLTDYYDISDPDSQQTVGIAKEEPPSRAKYQRLIVNKQLMPTRVNGYEEGKDQPAFSILTNWLRSRTTVVNEAGQRVGYFRTKLFFFGGEFCVFCAQDQQIADLKGDWKGWILSSVMVRALKLGLLLRNGAEWQRKYLHLRITTSLILIRR